MITIRISHNWCYTTWEDDSTEQDALREACSYRVADCWWSPAFRKRRWDGKRCLFRKVRKLPEGWFPTGILSHVVEQLKSKPIRQIHIEDDRVFPFHRAEADEANLTFELRDYQVEGVNAALRERRGVLKLPTAAGKTKVMIAVLAALDLPTLWITHEGALGRQSREQILGGLDPVPPVGFFAGGSGKRIQRWTVALVQSLYSRQSELQWWFDQIKVIVLDECHRTKGNMWYSVAMSIPAPFRYGISATPFERSDKSVLELLGATGQVIYEKGAEEIREHLSRPYVEMIHIPPSPRVTALNWVGVYQVGIIENRFRNRIVIDRAMRSVKEGSQCMVFVSRIDHGQKLDQMLSREIGISGQHKFISGCTPQFARDDLYSRLRSGDLKVLIATDKVAGEGQDIPNVRRVVVASGLKAAILAKQRIGRGMRPAGEGSGGWGGELQVHDFVDNQHPKLLNHSDRRRLHYANVGAVIKDTRDSVGVLSKGV